LGAEGCSALLKIALEKHYGTLYFVLGVLLTKHGPIESVNNLNMMAEIA
jgi:hypothetical protein